MLFFCIVSPMLKFTSIDKTKSLSGLQRLYLPVLLTGGSILRAVTAYRIPVVAASELQSGSTACSMHS